MSYVRSKVRALVASTTDDGALKEGLRSLLDDHDAWATAQKLQAQLQRIVPSFSKALGMTVTSCIERTAECMEVSYVAQYITISIRNRAWVHLNLLRHMVQRRCIRVDHYKIGRAHV